ncbi:N-6 DNA methylase [candidate division KSB1 bacterium]|nr:N-6 DNA methylase [candidate division KSB1 bacterium]
MRTEAKTKIAFFVNKFKNDYSYYKSARYDEAKTRAEFIEPFWEVLGWDVRNLKGVIHSQRDVIIEDRTKVRKSLKRPDYGFRIEGKTKFFLEAKKPAIDLTDPEPVFQAKRYAWSTNEVNFAVLTDFEEFRLFDCTSRPLINSPGRGLIKTFDLKYTDYLEKFDLIWETFSKGAVAGGSFERLLPKDRRFLKERKSVDKAFLEDLSGWREALARNIAIRNRRLSVYELNEAVQRLLDRLIFIRVCEDRNIETEEVLRGILNKWTAEKEAPLFCYLVDKFQKSLNPQYNGLLFDHHFLEDLEIDNRVLKEIIENLYYPKSPYQFDVLGVELLGSIYERFLGKTLRLTPQHHVKVEEKPEVRKAGGVYYTPKYIVDYIVDNTVGKLIEGKTPKEIRKLKFLDPACGSGSFLLGAFQKLIDYHVEYYKNHPRQIKKGYPYPECYQQDGKWKLSVHKKAEILVNNIYGVDIDRQAVEVTIMSLYLKVLEDEAYSSLFKQALLPEMTGNIKCGNSLIGTDVFSQGTLFDEDEERRINAFDWEDGIHGFGDIMEKGGFDCVIGNPPYVVLSKEGFDERVIKYLGQQFKEVTYQLDSYLLFMVQAVRLSKSLIGYIVPNAYLGNLKIVEFRKWLLRNTSIKQVVMLPPDVFEGAVVDTTIIVFSTKVSSINEIEVFKCVNGMTKHLYSLLQNDFLRTPEAKINIHIEPRIQKIIDKILKLTEPLRSYLEINRGVHAYRTDGYGKSKFSKGFQTQRDYDERSYHSSIKKDKTYKIEVRGKNIFRYYHTDMCEYISYGDWLAEPRDIRFFNQPRIYVRKIVGETLYAAFSDSENIPDQSVYIGILRDTTTLRLEFFLGIINSKLMVFLFRYMNNEFDTLFPQIKVTEFKQLPIRTIDFSNPKEVKMNDKLVSLVDRMLDLNKRKNALKSETERTRLQRQIDATDRKIDDLVYQLYDLTEKDIKIIRN